MTRRRRPPEGAERRALHRLDDDRRNPRPRHGVAGEHGFQTHARTVHLLDVQLPFVLAAHRPRPPSAILVTAMIWLTSSLARSLFVGTLSKSACKLFARSWASSGVMWAMPVAGMAPASMRSFPMVANVFTTSGCRPMPFWANKSTSASPPYCWMARLATPTLAAKSGPQS